MFPPLFIKIFRQPPSPLFYIQDSQRLNTVFLIMRRMRVPLLVLLTAYMIAIVGMTLVPGLDGKGQLWYMDFFHALYFVSYMGTTIGFGEIPYPFSDAQRMWATVSIYLTVIAWIYAIGAVLTLLQDEALRRVMTERSFTLTVQAIREPFYLICGYGDTGRALISALEERFLRSVVIELTQERINVLVMENYPVYVPKLCADASKPIHIVQGGLQSPYCAGVVAITDDNLVNLHVAITAKLLNPRLTVVCRVDSHEIADNMASFGTDYIFDPFDTFAAQLYTTIHAPGLFVLREWFADRYTNVCLNIPHQGRWVLCGYGRFGKAVHAQLQQEMGIHLVTIEAAPKEKGYPPGEYMIGRGTEAATLHQANIEEAVGLIAGTDDDVDNLSVVMTARQLNPNLFIVIRQNLSDNDLIFKAAHADIVMQPSRIIADHIRILLMTPLLIDFLALATQKGALWVNHLVEQLTTILENTSPIVWEVCICKEDAPAVCEALARGKPLSLECLRHDPRNYQQNLACLPLLLLREGQRIILPEDTETLQLDDRLLWCGKRSTPRWMEWSLRDPLILEYVATGEIVPRSYIGRWWQQRVANKGT